MKALIVVILCGALSGCGGLFCKPQDPVIQIVKEVHVVKEQVPDNLLVPCKRHDDLEYGVSPLYVLNLLAVRRAENNSCADQVDQIKIWRDSPGHDE